MNDEHAEHADLVARLPARWAIAVGLRDREAALEVCSDLVELEKHYVLAPRVPEKRKAVTWSGGVFRGKLMTARFTSSCVVCGGALPIGSVIRYSRAHKKASHEACGEMELRD